jgi:uncharacterized membrane protein
MRLALAAAHYTAPAVALSPTDVASALAPAGGLALAAAISSRCEPSSSPIATFALCSIMSNVGLIPASHSVYELCWSVLLPMSLSMLVVASSAGNPSSEADAKDAASVKAVGASFAIGSLGSIAGACSGFFFAASSKWEIFRLPRAVAARVAGALAASWIGGSFNLFEVAKSVNLSASTLGAMASADLLLMGLYFAALLAASRQASIRCMFGTHEGPGLPVSSEIEKHRTVLLHEQERLSFMTKGNAISDAAMVAALAWGMGRLAERVVIGAGTLVLTATSVGFGRLARRFRPHRHRAVANVAPGFAACLINVFFGAVGAGARASDIAAAGPAILFFTLLGLTVHALFILTVSMLLSRLSPLPLGLDETIIASNACVGGPATAAAFAGLLDRPDLVVPAAVWGTVGYAIASGIGRQVVSFLV